MLVSLRSILTCQSRDAKVARTVNTSEAARTATVTDQATSDKVVVESRVDNTQLVAAADEWPLLPRVEELCQDLFSPDWCIRHGACMGLREIVKLQGQVTLPSVFVFMILSM